jgi:hypothetical protein
MENFPLLAGPDERFTEPVCNGQACCILAAVCANRRCQSLLGVGIPCRCERAAAVNNSLGAFPTDGGGV